MSIQFSGIKVYQSTNPTTLQQQAAAETTSPIGKEFGQRQLGPTHELVDVTGKDQMALMGKVYNLELPAELKEMNGEEGMTAIFTQDQYAGLRNQITAFEEANRDPRSNFMDLTPMITMTTRLFEYLGFCLGKGATADGTPVEYVNLDTPQA